MTQAPNSLSCDVMSASRVGLHSPTLCCRTAPCKELLDSGRHQAKERDMEIVRRHCTGSKDHPIQPAAGRCGHQAMEPKLFLSRGARILEDRRPGAVHRLLLMGQGPPGHAPITEKQGQQQHKCRSKELYLVEKQGPNFPVIPMLGTRSFIGPCALVTRELQNFISNAAPMRSR